MAEYMQRGPSDKTVGQTPEPQKGGGTDGRTRPRSVRPAKTPPEMVEVRIERVFTDRGFGFARVRNTGSDHDGRQVFFRIEKFRVMGGLYEAPDFTEYPREFDPRLLDEPLIKVMMLVEESDRGLRAVGWGIAPKFDLRSSLKRVDLQQFVGGLISYMEYYRAYDEWGDPCKRPGYCYGELESIKVTSNGLLFRFRQDYDQEYERLARPRVYERELHLYDAQMYWHGGDLKISSYQMFELTLGRPHGR